MLDLGTLNNNLKFQCTRLEQFSMQSYLGAIDPALFAVIFSCRFLKFCQRQRKVGGLEFLLHFTLGSV